MTTSMSLPLLTDREMQVLHLLPTKLTNAQIGKQLSLAEDTVKTHLRRIGRKWGVTSRMAIVVTASQNGLLFLGPDTAQAVDDNARLWRFVFDIRGALGMPSAGRSTGESVLEATLATVRNVVSMRPASGAGDRR